MKRGRLARSLGLRAALVLFFARRLAPPALAVVVYVALATVVIRWDEGRAGLAQPPPSATAYGVFAQLFFQFTSYPQTTIARAIFWVTPLIGVLLVVEGLSKVGASLFDPAQRRAVWEHIVTSQLRGHVVVCGLGHVGYRVVEELRAQGLDVVGIERDDGGSFVDLVRAMDVLVIVGDARRDDLLVKAGIERARAVVCATADDLANLEVALDSKRMNPAVRVVLRMFDQRLAAKIGGALAVDASFSTSALAAPLIAMQATQEGVHAAYRLGDAIHVTIDVTVGEKLAGTTVAALEERWPCRVVGWNADGNVVRRGAVRAKDVLAAKDVIVIDADASDVARIRAGIEA
jgi:Trk K+ transport system NAD-binding subunit